MDKATQDIILQSVIILLVISAGAVALLYCFLTRWITKPLRNLTEGAAIVGKGNLGHKVAVTSHDEIGRLAGTFNKMTEDLKKTTTSVESLNQALAERKKTEERLRDAYNELKKAQDHLIQSEKLRALGELATGVAHELKNPLGIILQGVGYLEKRKELVDDTALEVIALLKSNIRRADDIIKALSDFAKEKPVHKQAEDLENILDFVVTVIDPKCREKSIVVVKEYGSALPPVFIDRTMIQEAVLNLALNAIQAMPAGGRLSLRTSEVVLKKGDQNTGERAGDRFRFGEHAVVVELEDTGEGISEENLRRVLDPFFTTKRSDKSSGLGLTVAKKIMDIHEGAIEIEGEEGRGTTARLILKIA